MLWLATVSMVALISILSLWPLTRWQPPTWVTNGAAVIDGEGLRFSTPGVVRSARPPPWLESLRADPGQVLTIRLRLRTFALDQRGPARIMTISADPSRRNLTLAQRRSDLILRLRFPGSDLNGQVDGRDVARLPGLFTRSGWHDIELAIAPDRLRLGLNGRTVVDRPLPAPPFTDWDPHYLLAFGNELTYDRPWLGAISSAEITLGDRTVDYAAGGDLVRPAAYWHVVSWPKLRPLEGSTWLDAANNVLLYLPLGVLLGWLGWRWPVWRWIIAIALLSLTMEALQIAIPRRHPALDDVVSNTTGGGIGLALASWLRRYRIRTSLRDATGHL